MADNRNLLEYVSDSPGLANSSEAKAQGVNRLLVQLSGVEAMQDNLVHLPQQQRPPSAPMPGATATQVGERSQVASPALTALRQSPSPAVSRPGSAAPVHPVATPSPGVPASVAHIQKLHQHLSPQQQQSQAQLLQQQQQQQQQQQSHMQLLQQQQQGQAQILQQQQQGQAQMLQQQQQGQAQMLQQQQQGQAQMLQQQQQSQAQLLQQQQLLQEFHRLTPQQQQAFIALQHQRKLQKQQLQATGSAHSGQPPSYQVAMLPTQMASPASPASLLSRPAQTHGVSSAASSTTMSSSTSSASGRNVAGALLAAQQASHAAQQQQLQQSEQSRLLAEKQKLLMQRQRTLYPRPVGLPQKEQQAQGQRITMQQLIGQGPRIPSVSQVPAQQLTTPSTSVARQQVADTSSSADASNRFVPLLPVGSSTHPPTGIQRITATPAHAVVRAEQASASQASPQSNAPLGAVAAAAAVQQQLKQQQLQRQYQLQQQQQQQQQQQLQQQTQTTANTLASTGTASSTAATNSSVASSLQASALGQNSSPAASTAAAAAAVDSARLAQLQQLIASGKLTDPQQQQQVIAVVRQLQLLQQQKLQQQLKSSQSGQSLPSQEASQQKLLHSQGMVSQGDGQGQKQLFQQQLTQAPHSQQAVLDANAQVQLLQQRALAQQQQLQLQRHLQGEASSAGQTEQEKLARVLQQISSTQKALSAAQVQPGQQNTAASTGQSSHGVILQNLFQSAVGLSTASSATTATTNTTSSLANLVGSSTSQTSVSTQQSLSASQLGLLKLAHQQQQQKQEQARSQLLMLSQQQLLQQLSQQKQQQLSHQWPSEVSHAAGSTQSNGSSSDSSKLSGTGTTTSVVGQLASLLPQWQQQQQQKRIAEQTKSAAQTAQQLPNGLVTKTSLTGAQVKEVLGTSQMSTAASASQAALEQLRLAQQQPLSQLLAKAQSSTTSQGANWPVPPAASKAVFGHYPSSSSSNTFTAHSPQPSWQQQLNALAKAQVAQRAGTPTPATTSLKSSSTSSVSKPTLSPSVSQEKQMPVRPVKREAPPANVPSKVSAWKPLNKEKDQLNLKQSLRRDCDVLAGTDGKKPFSTFADACFRLLHYHVFWETEAPLDVVEKCDRQLEEAAESVINRRDELVQKYQHFLIRQSMEKPHKSEETLLQRLMLEDEQQVWLEEKQQAIAKAKAEEEESRRQEFEQTIGSSSENGLPSSTTAVENGVDVKRAEGVINGEASGPGRPGSSLGFDSTGIDDLSPLLDSSPFEKLDMEAHLSSLLDKENGGSGLLDISDDMLNSPLDIQQF